MILSNVQFEVKDGVIIYWGEYFPESSKRNILVKVPIRVQLEEGGGIFPITPFI